MRKYSLVAPQLWRSKRFRDLPNDAAKLFYLFTVTGPHQTSAGVFRVPDGYAASDMGWTETQVAEARASLIDAGMIVFDVTTEEYFVTRWYKHNHINNKNHRAGVMRIVNDQTESELIRRAAADDYEAFGLKKSDS